MWFVLGRSSSAKISLCIAEIATDRGGATTHNDHFGMFKTVVVHRRDRSIRCASECIRCASLHSLCIVVHRCESYCVVVLVAAVRCGSASFQRRGRTTQNELTRCVTMKNESVRSYWFVLGRSDSLCFVVIRLYVYLSRCYSY